MYYRFQRQGVKEKYVKMYLRYFEMSLIDPDSLFCCEKLDGILITLRVKSREGKDFSFVGDFFMFKEFKIPQGSLERFL